VGGALGAVRGLSEGLQIRFLAWILSHPESCASVNLNRVAYSRRVLCK
jgi:hypothetical protein